MSTASTPPDRRPGPPLWLVEGLDIVESRRRIVLGVAGLIIVVGLLLALLAPGVLPPTPLVGVAVAVAALLIGVAAAIVVDSSDLRVRGPRHVVAAGGELVAVLPVAEDADAADELAAVVLEARSPDRSMLLGLAASSLDIAATLRWTDALGVALARRGVSVLRVDLASGRSDTPGLAEVAAGERKLTEVVDYEPGVLLARLGAGGDHRDALAALSDLPAKLPRDLEVLLVALPIAASRGVVQAARGLDHVLVVAERGDTSRVDLIAGLDALRAADLQAQVILLDDLTAGRIASGGSTEVVPVRSRADDDTGEVADEQPPASLEEPVVVPEGDVQPTARLEEPVAAPEQDELPTAVVEEPVAAPVEDVQPTARLEEPVAGEDDVPPALTPPEEPGAEEVGGQPTAAIGSRAVDVDAPEEPGTAPAPGPETAPEPLRGATSGPPEPTSEPDPEPDSTSELEPTLGPSGTDDEDLDADGPPPLPAAAFAGAPREPAAPADDSTVRLAPADEALAPADLAEPVEPPADPDDASARVAAIVRAVMADHRKVTEGPHAPAEADRGGSSRG